MTNQLQGEILFKGWSGTGDNDWANTPWMPVRGGKATFGVEVVAINGVTLTWEVQTRDLESPSVTTIATPAGMTTVTTLYAFNSTSLAVAKQLVRYRFKTGSGASTTDYVIFRALQPSWQIDR